MYGPNDNSGLSFVILFLVLLAVIALCHLALG